MNSQPLNTMQVIPPPVLNPFWCPDLISTRDLGASGVEAMLHMAAHHEGAAGRFSRRASGQADGDVFREAFAANQADL